MNEYEPLREQGSDDARMRESTFQAIVAMLKADHEAANWGSVDAPRFGRKAKDQGETYA